jgi:SWI/SNF-related matrix-associated actin-dependent regulator of chromatin subfamily A3
MLAPIVTTPLYSYQKQALSFLIDRERIRTLDEVGDPGDEGEERLISLWRVRRDLYNRHVGWTNVVTDVEISGKDLPPQSRGAILADDMGLGKTLVVISLIATTLSTAVEFAAKPVTTSRPPGAFDALSSHPGSSETRSSTPQSDASSFQGFPGLFHQPALGRPPKKKPNKTQKKKEEAEVDRLSRLIKRSRATLIVCPLSTVQNWESQIEEHTRLPSSSSDDAGASTSTRKKGLSVYVYHGIGRTTDPDVLADNDVVLTTFSTLGTEYSRQSRAEEPDESDSSGIEELDPTTGLPVGKPKKAKAKKKRRKVEGSSASPLQQIEWFRVVLDEAQ